MFRKNAIRAGALCLVLLVSCQQKTPEPASTSPQLDPAAFDGAKALEEARSLVALGPRAAATPGSEAAARHLADRLKAFGVEASVDEFTDICPTCDSIWKPM